MYKSIVRRFCDTAGSGKNMLVLSERDVRRSLPLLECLDINRKAYISLSNGMGVVPNRLGLTYPNKFPKNTGSTAKVQSSSPPQAQDWTLIKPAAYYVGDDDANTSNKASTEENEDQLCMGLKVVSVRSNNPSKFGLPLVPATTILVNPSTGIVSATVSATHLTVARTSAGPALAVQTFQPYAEHLVVFGAGAQAEYHIKLMQIALQSKHQRVIPHITIINRTLENAEKLQQKLLKDDDVNGTQACTIDVVALDDTKRVKEALKTADIVSTTTNSSVPLWSEDDGGDNNSSSTTRLIKPSCLITSVGSYTPDMAEIPQSVVNRSYVLVDTPEAVHVGDLKHLNVDPSQVLVNELELSTEKSKNKQQNHHPVALFGMTLADPQCVEIPRGFKLSPKQEENQDCGKQTNNDIDCIFYKSVGTAIQDVLTTDLVVRRAKSLGIGQQVDMT